MGKPVDIFENQEQLEECLREWQHRLFLDGWLILAHVEDKIMNSDGEEVIDAAGYNTFVFESSQANIQLLSDESYKENNVKADKILARIEEVFVDKLWNKEDNCYAPF